MISLAPTQTNTEERINFFILISLAPTAVGFICSFLSNADPGGGWWLVGGLVNLVALLGIAVAILIALLSAALRRIGLPFLGFAFVEIGVAALLLWIGAKLIKSPWV